MLKIVKMLCSDYFRLFLLECLTDAETVQKVIKGLSFSQLARRRAIAVRGEEFIAAQSRRTPVSAD